MSSPGDPRSSEPDTSLPNSGANLPHSSTRRIPWLCGAIFILLNLGAGALPAPAARLFEAALCRRHYESHESDQFPPGSDIPERYCKLQDIQIAVASTISIITVATRLAELAVQIPIGILADLKGRRLVLALNVTSAICYWSWLAISGLCFDVLPFWSVFLAPLFTLIGGRGQVSNAMLFATVSDVVSPEKRTTYFSYLESAVYITKLLSPAIGSFMMSYRPVATFITSIACITLSYIPILFIVEPQPQPTLEHSETPEGSEDELLLGENTEPEGDSDDDEAAEHVNKGYGQFSKYYLPKIKLHLLETWRMLATNRNIVLSLAAFFLSAASRSSMNLLLQYVSRKYAWTIAQAGYLFSLKAAISAVLFLVLIPWIGVVLRQHTTFRSHQINLLIVQTSVFILALGSAVIGLAIDIWALVFGFVILALGSGAGIVLKSFLSDTVSDNHNGRLYSVIGAFETLGAMLGTPFLAVTYSWGLKHGYWALGIPYLISAILYTFAGVVVCCIRKPA